MTTINCESISFSFGEQQVLHDLDFAASPGRLTSIIGPNGTGKTTLLRILTGYFRPTKGRISIQGKSSTLLRRREHAALVALVPQIEPMAFALRLREYVALGRTPHISSLGTLTGRDKEVINRAIERAGVRDLGNRLVTELSGGEQHRVLIARALAQDTPILLLDEPNAHMDIRHQLELFTLLRYLAHEEGRTVVCVTHDINLAGSFSDEVALLAAGKVVAHGEPTAVCSQESLREHFGVETCLIPQPDGRMLIRFLAPAPDGIPRQL